MIDDKKMMNPLQIIQQEAHARFSSLESELLEPILSTGRWILELRLDDWRVAVGWLPNREIGVSASSTPELEYGTGFDEIFSESDINLACKRALELLSPN